MPIQKRQFDLSSFSSAQDEEVSVEPKSRFDLSAFPQAPEAIPEPSFLDKAQGFIEDPAALARYGAKKVLPEAVMQAHEYASDKMGKGLKFLREQPLVPLRKGLDYVLPETKNLPEGVNLPIPGIPGTPSIPVREAAGALRGTANIAESFTTGENLAILLATAGGSSALQGVKSALARYAPAAVDAVFGALALQHAPEAWQAYKDAPPEEKTERLVEAVGSIGLGLMAGVGAKERVKQGREAGRQLKLEETKNRLAQETQEAEALKSRTESLRVENEKAALQERLERERNLEVGGETVGESKGRVRKVSEVEADIQKRLTEIPEEQIPSDPKLKELLNERTLQRRLGGEDRFDLSEFKEAPKKPVEAAPSVLPAKTELPISEREQRAQTPGEANSASFKSALDDFIRAQGETKGKPLSEQLAVAKTRLEEKGYHPAIVDELTAPERLKRPEIEGDVSEATTRPGRLKRAVEPPPELKEKVDLVADKAIKFRDAEASYNKGREEIFRKVERLGGKIIVDSMDGTFKIEIKPGKARLSMQDQLALVKLKQEAAEAGAYSLATLGKGFQIAAAPLRIKQGESLKGSLAEKVAEFISRKKALKSAESDFRKSEKALVDPYTDFYFKNKLEGKENSSLIGRGEVPVEVQLRRKPSDTLPDEPQARQKIVATRKEMQKRASELGPQGEPFVETRKIGAARAEAEKAAGTSFFDIRGNLSETDRVAWDAVQKRAAESFGRTSANEIVNPQVWKDLAETGYYVSKALGRASKGKAVEFAEWANQMVKQFGEKIRPILQDLWNDIKGGFEPEKKPVFYSHTAKVLENKLPNSAPAAQMKNVVEAFVKKGEIPKEEVEWSGLLEWLDKKEGKVTKQEVAEFLRENRIKLREVEGGDEFEQYQLPGGENYKELLLALPYKRKHFKEIALEMFGKNYEYLPAEEIGKVNLATIEQNKRIPKYTSPHFDEPNILAHVRLNERTGKNGERILFLEEIQSDWHQQGREKGYKKSEAVRAAEKQSLEKRRDEIGQELLKSGWFDSSYPELQKRVSATELDRLARLDSEQSQIIHRLRTFDNEVGIPDAPFKTSWHELAFKRMLRYAVDNGFDKIAWTTGEQQAARYDLSKQVNSVLYEPATKRLLVEGKGKEVLFNESGVSEQRMSDVVGKELTEKILTSEPNWRNSVRLTGLDLKVGGEGMKGFYDKIVPEFVNNYTKKWGGKVKDEEIKVGTGSSFPDLTLDLTPEMTSGVANAHVLSITPEMTAGVAKGQPLFGRAKLFDVTRNLSESEVSALNASKERLKLAKQEYREELSGSFLSPTIPINPKAWKEYVEIGYYVGKGLARNLGEFSKVTFENFKESLKTQLGDLYKKIEPHVALLWDQIKALPETWKPGDEIPELKRAEHIAAPTTPERIAEQEKRWNFGLPLTERLANTNPEGAKLAGAWNKANNILKTTLGRGAVEIRNFAKEAGLRRDKTTPHLDVVNPAKDKRLGANLLFADMINNPELRKNYPLTDLEKRILAHWDKTHITQEKEVAPLLGKEPDLKPKFTPTLNNEMREAIYVEKGGPLFEAFVNTVSARSGVPREKVEAKVLRGDLSGLDIPTHVYVKDQLVSIGSADAISALQAQNFEHARTMGLLKTFGSQPKKAVAELRKEYMSKPGADGQIFDRTRDAYFGLRPRDSISTLQNSRSRVARLLFRTVDPVFSSLALSMSAPLQISQPFMDLRSVGWKNMLKTYRDLFKGELSGDDLERMGMVNRDVLNLRFSEGEKLEDYGRAISALANRGDLMHGAALFNDLTSATHWRHYINSIKEKVDSGKGLSAKDKQTLKTDLGVTDAELARIEQGRFEDPLGKNPETPEQELFVQLVRQGKTGSQHTGKLGVERTKFQTSPAAQFWLKFQSYTIGEFQRWRRETANLERAHKFGSREEKAEAWKRFGKLLGTTALQGEIINLIRHTIKGEWDEADEDSSIVQLGEGNYGKAFNNFLWNTAEAGFMGPFTRAYLTFQIAGRGVEALADSFFWTNFVHELINLGFEKGKYSDKTFLEKQKAFWETRAPALRSYPKVLTRSLALVDLAKEDGHKTDFAIRSYYDWLDDTGRGTKPPEKEGYLESRRNFLLAYRAYNNGDDEDVMPLLIQGFDAKIAENPEMKPKEALERIKNSLRSRIKVMKNDPNSDYRMVSKYDPKTTADLIKKIGQEKYDLLVEHDQRLKRLLDSLVVTRAHLQRLRK